MRFLRLVVARCRALVRRDVVTDEIREEMLFHLRMRAEEYEREGLGPEDARRAAARRFGNLTLMRDRGYDVRGGGVIETILQDARYAARSLWQHRAFSSIAVLTLALGIGLSTAVFSVIDAALLRPLPYPHPEELVTVWVRTAWRGKSALNSPSMADIRAWRESGLFFAHVGTGRALSFRPEIVEIGQAERLVVGEVSEDFLEVYGVTPILGRAIQIEDTRKGAPLVVLLGHGFWRTRFAGATDAVGRVIRIAGEPATIVGVLPAGFYRETAVWKPTRFSHASVGHRSGGRLVLGRLRRGLPLAEAERALADWTTRNAPAGESEQVIGVRLTSLTDDVGGGSGDTVALLAAAVGLILLIACVNVGGLLLARGTVRKPELAIRAAIGAGRGRLVRQLLTESLVLSAAGGMVGLVLLGVAFDAILALVPLSLPENSPARLNLPALGSAVLLTVITSVLCGLAPALNLSRARPGSQLAVAGRGHGSALSRRTGQLLISGQVALAVVLLAVAGLMVRSFNRLAAVDVGFDPTAVVTLEAEPLDQSPAVRHRFYPELVAALRTLPEVEAAGGVDFLPMRDGTAVTFVEGMGDLNVGRHQILPGYFEALGVRAKLGRLPTETDRTGAEQVALLNEEAARLLFPTGPAVGQFLRQRRNPPLRIIGVVSNVRHWGPEEKVWPEVYTLYGQGEPTDRDPLRIVLRPRSGATLDADRLRRVAQAVGPPMLVERIRFSTDDFGERVAKPRQRTLLLSLLAGLGLLLALVGIVGVTAYAVARRTREIGIRMAFGAGARNVVMQIVGDAAWPAGLGLVAGMAGAFFATRLVASFLFQTTPHDPATFGAVAAVMSIAAIAAAWLPARRAARVDPVTALRVE